MANLLLIDDMLFTGRFMKKALEHEAHPVSWIRDDLDAMDAGRAHGADLVLINQRCQKGAGWDIYNRLKEDAPGLPALLYFLEENKLSNVIWVLKAVDEALRCLQRRRFRCPDAPEARQDAAVLRMTGTD